MNWKVWLLLGSAAALMIGAGLPWVSWVGLWGEAARGSESLAIGWEGDGVVTALCGLIIAAVALWARSRTGLWVTVAVWGPALIALLVVVGDVARIAEIGPEAGVLATIRVGLVVTFAGALLGFAGGAAGIPARGQA